ncbi:adhesion G-protein coupled receptor G1 isoform X2 [Channa argus]|uniref:adhesion G-protein coupled receptor G1 isoform X2 n=1 Tax=Channa argus TaxID=215402 RepID=UPI0035229770
MEYRITDNLKVVFVLIILMSTGSSQYDRYLDFCGTWRHGKGHLNLSVNLSRGCDGISVSANETTLSIDGKITSQCMRFDLIPLNISRKDSSKFCLNWEPLLDLLTLQIGGKNLTLCWPSSLHGSCCTDLSHGPNEPEAKYGIANGKIRTDFITEKTHTGYKFIGQPINCTLLCDQERDGSMQATKSEPICAQRSEVEMKADFGGFNVTAPAPMGVSKASTVTVHLPRALKRAETKTSKVHCTFFKNISLFQEDYKKFRVLDDVVDITVENEIIADLSEPIRITFYHDFISKMHPRKCVSWDTRKDPLMVSWSDHGCKTNQEELTYTECLCNHLTYFSVLVQLEPRPVRHLLALTTITSLGCAVSFISCVALIIYLCRKRRSKEQSTPIHLGLAVSLALLNLLFFFTGVLANAGGENVCTWVGAGLHYALLSSFTWMGIEVFHTFWLVYRVFSPSPKPYIWILAGFVVPAVPVIILASVGGIYGIREVVPSNDVSNPYLMCWMTNTYKALLAHYFTNMPIVVILVLSGIVMLFVVYREIKTREEWRKNSVAFLSLWGLSCLFGTTWGLGFLDFGPLSDFFLFTSCILNSFQGFLLMLRFFMLDWMRKQAGGSAVGSSSTGSTRQHMLKANEKS